MNQLVSSTDSSTGVTTTYTYDTYGNLIDDGKFEYGYDEYFNRLEYVYNTETDEVTLYDYYVDGLRKRKDNTYFVWLDGNIVYEFTSDDSNTYTYGHRLLYSDNAKYVLNAHGDVVALLNDSGVVTKRYRYDAFGNELNPSESDTNPFRYCAEYFDFETGQIYLRARYYQPIVGRFSQKDTHWNTANMIYGDEVKTKEYKDYLGLNTYTVKLVDYAAVRQSGNLYGYCGNDPLSHIDFLGEKYTNTVINNGKGNYSVVTSIKVLWFNVEYKYKISNGVVKFDFTENDYSSAMLYHIEDDLSEAIYDTTKPISNDYLSGRTADGIKTEIQLHYGAYIAGIKKENAKVADIGGINKDKAGYDSNAWFFEGVSVGKYIVTVSILNSVLFGGIL